MLTIRNMIVVLFGSLLLVACGSDRANSDTIDPLKSNGVLGVVLDLDADRDGDGLSNDDEVNIYGTNPDNNDTDNDGLLDAEEINTYDTNATNSDTDDDGLNDGDEVNIYGTDPKNSDGDNDGLTDGQEINTYGTDANSSDTDGDCLLDGFEVLNYETNASNVDTDGDKVADGIEIYSYSANDLNVSCLTSPETFDGGANPTPAMDNIPSDGTDVINALDPNNDSDSDGQTNLRENNCTEGDPLDGTKLCPYITETEEGNILSKHGYTYVPGGFDVDGDGVNEGGFWMSRYQARSNGVLIPSQDVITTVGNINQYISTNFKVLNRNIEVTAYNEAFLSETNTLGGTELTFDELEVSGTTRSNGITPYLALVELSKYILINDIGVSIDVNVTLPTLKQYVQVQMLLAADLANNSDGRHIRNGLLAIDENVPLTAYSVIIEEFGSEYREYLRNLVQLRETNTNDIIPIFSIDDLNTTSYEWWRIDLNNVIIPNGGALSNVAIEPYTAGLNADPYAVLVRGGESMDFSYGITGAEGDTVAPNKGIGFRAATDYLY